MHARKTRQRKKEHMHVLQDRVAELKREQLRLRQVINEKATASILLGMFGKAAVQDEPSSEDPEVDALMKRPVEEIPDASKIPELPALILRTAQLQEDSRGCGGRLRPGRGRRGRSFIFSPPACQTP